MADFYGCLEASAFRVKDKTVWLSDHDVQQIKERLQQEGFFEEETDYWAFGCYGQYPSPLLTFWNEETNEEKEISILDVVQRHIVPGDVCQIGVSGNEKLRYIGGGVWWVTSKGVLYFNAETAWDNKMTESELKEVIGTLMSDYQNLAKEES